MKNQRTSSSRPSLSVIVPRTTTTMTMTMALLIAIVLQSCHNNNSNHSIPLFAMGLSTTMPMTHGPRIPFNVNYITQEQPSNPPSSSTRFNSRRTVLPSKSSSLFSSSQNEEDEDDNQLQQQTSAELVDNDNSLESDSLESAASSASSSSKSFLSNLRNIFRNKNKLNRESLSKLGLSALLAYGFVSNVSGVIAVSSAWFIFSKRTGISPLANKPAFLTIYAGFTVILNVIRPARFALSVAISPYFERLRASFQQRFGVSAKVATGLVVVFVNLLGTSALMACGVGLASLLAGVPVWVK